MYATRNKLDSHSSDQESVLRLAQVGTSVDSKASLWVMKGISEESDTKGRCHLVLHGLCNLISSSTHSSVV